MPAQEVAVVDVTMLEEALATMVAPWVRDLGLHVTSAQPGEVHLSLPVKPVLVHVMPLGVPLSVM